MLIAQQVLFPLFPSYNHNHKSPQCYKATATVGMVVMSVIIIIIIIIIS